MNLFTSSKRPSLRRSLLLAPSHGAVPKEFPVSWHAGEHSRLLAEAQRFRGRVYLADGAIQEYQLTVSGRHVQPADNQSFHLILLDEDGQVVACTRYLPHSSGVGFSQLGVSQTPLTANQRLKLQLERAVAGEISRARSLGFNYVEMGGWAITEDLRCTGEAVRMVVTIYALARMLGGALGVSTVTKRHASSSILRRLGGAPLTDGPQEVLPYYDPNYDCEMEILRFDSDHPSKTYEHAIRRCQEALARTPFLAPEPADTSIPMFGPLVATATA